MVASHPGWCLLADGESGGDEVLPRGLLCYGSSGMVDRVFREKSLLARLTPTRCRLWVASFLPEGRRGYSLSTFLCAGANPKTSVLVQQQRGCPS